jgi:4-amino-4-deoxy-L-arabinose transferase-like glycosyltransferase
VSFIQLKPPPPTQAPETKPAARQTALELFTIAGFCAFLFYFGLGAFGLVGADEPRYAQIAREMLERRDVITPTLYGKPWLEKPPLYYWRAMEAFAVTGVHDWAARLPSAAAATLLVFVVYFFMRAFRRGAELNAALMTAACVGTIGYSRAAGPDMLLAAAFAVGMLFWWSSVVVLEHAPSTGSSARNAKPETRNTRWHRPKLWLALFYLFMAFGMLAKGPVAPVLAAVIIVLFAAVQRDWTLVRRTLWWPGILLFIAIAAPWYVAVQIKNPQFFREFILQHNLERFATNRYHHKKAFWYYLPVTLVAVLPWTAFFIAGFIRAIRSWKDKAGDRLPLFLALSIIVIVVFFSASVSKLPGYILPAVPACTLLAAGYLQSRDGKMSWALILFQGLFSALLLNAALLFPRLALHPHEPLPSQAKVALASVAIAVFVGTIFSLAWRGTAVLRLVVLAPLVVGLAFLIKIGGPVIDVTMSERPVASSIAEIEGGRETVAVFKASREVEYGLAFYRNRAIPRYERDGIPGANHLVVVPDADTDDLLKAVRPKRASRVDGFPAQHLQFFWISPQVEHMPMGSAPPQTP